MPSVAIIASASNMALIKCQECGREVSSFAVSCPQCGFPIGATPGMPAPESSATSPPPEPPSSVSYGQAPETGRKGALGCGSALAIVTLFTIVIVAVVWNLDSFTQKNEPAPESNGPTRSAWLQAAGRASSGPALTQFGSIYARKDALF